MSRRRRGSRPAARRPPWSSTQSLPIGGAPPKLRDRLASASVPALALLPVRFFFGATFVYAGLDKLLDPDFFNPAAAASIQNQFAIFERFSPLAPLVHLAAPLAVPLGLLIALGEIGAGLGALTGIAYRLSALGGALLAGMFFLTASWTIHPFYLGPDLPYMIGWLSLALAGHGDLLVPAFVSRAAAPAPRAEAGLVPRRQLLQVGALAVITLFVGALAGGFRLLAPGLLGVQVGAEPTPDASLLPTPASSQSPGETPATTPGAQPTPAGIVVANVADVERSGSKAFRVPVTAPAPLPAGDPGLIVRLPDGSFAAYDATCTHEGCRVGWDAADGVMLCPCHGAAFDPARHGAVIAGPTRVPLTELPLVIDQQAGTIALAT